MTSGAYNVEVHVSKEYTVLQARMGYVFKDSHLLEKALTHSSFGDGRRKQTDNERLEFLGDRVLGLVTAQMLYKAGNDNEGSMARRLNALVRKETCADIAREIDLGSALLMSRSEERQGGRDKTSILGDACEALIAAVFLDGGLEAVTAFYQRHWKTRIDQVLLLSGKDAKTELQERASARGKSAPVYELTRRSGPDHKPEFTVLVTVDGAGDGVGIGPSKKIAERLAAQSLLENWK